VPRGPRPRLQVQTLNPKTPKPQNPLSKKNLSKYLFLF
jgi:hypothetical protein